MEHGFPAPPRFPLIGHFEEDQIGDLLDIIPVAHAVVTQDVGVVPDFIDDF